MKNRITKKELIKAAKRASAQAIAKTRAAGGTITYQSGKSIIREYPDGRKEVIQVLEKAYIRVKRKRYKLISDG